MKSVLFILLAFPIVQDGHLEQITAALDQGNVQSLEQYLDERVEIVLLEEGGVYARADAVHKLKAFFTTHPGTTFQAIHKGFSGGKSSLYCIGDLRKQGERYRVFMYIRVEGGQYLIEELRFEKN